MVNVEGTYTTVRGQEFVDFYVNLGVENEKATMAQGTNWTLKMWQDGTLWGGHLTCQELPHLNHLDVMAEGSEKCIDNPLVGGKAKMLFKRKSDNEFETIVKSEKFGTILLEERYTDEGAYQKWTANGKSFTEFWQRCIKTEGAYRFEKGENIEAFFDAIGFPEMKKHYKCFKAYLCKSSADSVKMTECFGDLSKICNTLTLDIEFPFRTPLDKGGEPTHKAVVTETGLGQHLMVIKSPEGRIEEWKLSFTDGGLLMEGLDKKSGISCKLYLKRFTEMSGTYKVTSIVGFENFAHAMGVSCNKIQEMANDCTARMIICDKGDGYQHHKLTGKGKGLDVSFKLNQEFSFIHPMLDETVKAMVTKHDDNILCVNLQMSKGTISTSFTFNDTFVVKSVCHTGSGLRYKAILERCCD